MRELVVVLLSGVILIALYHLLGVLVRKLFARAGIWVDRVRTMRLDPARELAGALRALLILSFLVEAARLLALPRTAAYLIYPIWALDLLGELRTRFACKMRPNATLALHERGFFLLDHGPLETRLMLAAFVGTCHELVPFVAHSVGLLTGILLAGGRWVTS